MRIKQKLFNTRSLTKWLMRPKMMMMRLRALRFFFCLVHEIIIGIGILELISVAKLRIWIRYSCMVRYRNRKVNRQQKVEAEKMRFHCLSRLKLPFIQFSSRYSQLIYILILSRNEFKDKIILFEICQMNHLSK